MLIRYTTQPRHADENAALEFNLFVQGLSQRCAQAPARVESDLLGRYEG